MVLSAFILPLELLVTVRSPYFTSRVCESGDLINHRVAVPVRYVKVDTGRHLDVVIDTEAVGPTFPVDRREVVVEHCFGRQVSTLSVNLQ